MCTATIRRHARTLLVTMNRDESRQRAPERPPAIYPAAEDRPAWAAPLDGQAGGTWIGANSRGVVACLLNAYLPGEADAPDTPAEGRPSRGEIIPALLTRGGLDDVRAWLRGQFNPAPYERFTLVVASIEGCETFSQDRKGLLRRAPLTGEWALVASSLWNPAEVLSWRRREFQRWRENGCPFAGSLPLYHLLQPPDQKDRSPLMDRPLACTRSITQVLVDESQGCLEMRYWPWPTPESGFQPPSSRLQLPLAQI